MRGGGYGGAGRNARGPFGDGIVDWSSLVAQRLLTLRAVFHRSLLTGMAIARMLHPVPPGVSSGTGKLAKKSLEFHPEYLARLGRWGS